VDSNASHGADIASQFLHKLRVHWHDMRRSVLVVDDDPKLVELLRLYLERDGYRVRTAAGGPQALEALRNGQPDLVILDLMLPEMDGLEVCRVLREEADTPVIMLTARTSEKDRITGFDLGADDYVTKPFSPGELLARVRAVLRRVGEREGPDELSFGELKIDLLRHEVLVGEDRVELTPTEFRLLEAMAREPGRVFTRQQLIHAALGYDFEGFERTIDAHVKNLRRKIEADPKVPSYIRTVFGVGYRFVPPEGARAT